MLRDTQPITTISKYLQIVLIAAVILYFGKPLFIPLFLGLLIAIIMFPLCKWLEKHGWRKSLAIAACLLFVTLLLSALFGILVWQLSILSKDAPAIISKIDAELEQLQSWMIQHTRLAGNDQYNWIEKFSGMIGGILQSTFQTTFSTLFIFFLTPVYTALFMYHRKIFVQFLKLIIPVKYNHQLDTILHETVHTYFNYIKGMILVYLIVGILNSIGLLVLGVKYPFLFGMLCAIMTIIPYVGIFISALLPISMIWIETGNFLYPLGVVAIFSFVQYLEANVIFPKVVGSQLHINTLAVLVAVIAGGIIWGVAGMVLFIPFVAILKIISDNIEEWKAISLLLSRN